MIVITGGAGVIGRALVQRLGAAGHAIRVLTLPGDPNASLVEQCGAEVRYGDVSAADDVAALCDGAATVYHLAAVIIACDDRLYRKINVEGTRNVVEAAKKAGVQHFIHVSSASVVYPKPTPYSLSKRECEAIVRQSGVPFTIVRPTLVYDKRGGQEFDMFLAYLCGFPVVPFIGGGQAKKRPVFAGDVVEGLCSLHGKPVAYGKTYNFSGGEVVSMLALSRLCLKLMGKERKPIVHLAVPVCVVLARLMERVMRRPPLRWPVIAGVTQDADLDPSEAVRDLGFCPSPVSDKLPECFPRALP